MIGSAEATRSTRTGWPAKMGRMQRRYAAVDGGAGAHLLAALSGMDSRLRPAPSPRHADLLIVMGPITRNLVPALLEYARALPQPAQALIVDTAASDLVLPDYVPAMDLLPRSPQVDVRSAEQIVDIVQRLAPWPSFGLVTSAAFAEDTIKLPNKQQRELATEMAVLSLGPIQALTAGPLRLLLICDGEQVLQAKVEAGFARRGIAEAMIGVTWQEAATIASAIDPLAHVAGRLAYVQALEHLQQWLPPSATQEARQAALAVERAANHLWWLHRFLAFLAAPVPTERAWQCAMAVTRLGEALWPQPTTIWLAPRHPAPNVRPVASAELQRIVTKVGFLRQCILRNRSLELRLRGVGVLPAGLLDGAGVSGPVRHTAEHGAGDAWSRLQTRLLATATDLEAAGTALDAIGDTVRHEADRTEGNWHAPAGDADVAVQGPRGQLGLHLVSGGGSGPAQVEWRRPSAALLALLPAALAGQKLADAETLVASLDLAMAEADG